MSENRDTRLRFEQWAKNPQCMANAISAVHNVRMADVAKAEGVKPSFGQSPFALARGQAFERSLFRDGAKSMLEALHKSGVLPEDRTGFEDFRLRMNGGKYRTHDDALEATRDLLARAAAATTDEARRRLPAVLAGPIVRIPGGLMLPEAILVIDVMVVQLVNDRVRLMVGEVKTYPDRGGFTESGELATARAQAGVYVHGLRLVLAEMNLGEALDVSPEGFLVLTRPGFSRPSIRAGESLEYQAQRAERGFARLREVAAQLGGSTDPNVVIPRIREADTNYCEACLSFCDRAPVCHERALQSGDAGVLGDEVRHFLGAISLPRAIALMGGAKAENEAEADLLGRLDDLGERGAE